VNVESLFDRQLDNLVTNINILHASHGLDQNAYQRVRSQVAGELLHQGQLQVASAALGYLDDEGAEQRLNDIINHCAQHYEMPDRVLSVIAVPVSISIKQKEGRPFELQFADANCLDGLAMLAKNITVAQRIVFSDQIFDARTLFYCKAQKLFNFAKALDSGVQRPDVGIKQKSIAANAEGTWQMVYLLGIAETAIDQELNFDQQKIQFQLGRWTHQAEFALTEQKVILFNKSLTAKAHCHGIYYLLKALQVGEDLMRGHQMEEALAVLSVNQGAIQLFYTQDQLNFEAKLLGVSAGAVIQYNWKLLGAETLERFEYRLRQGARRVFGQGATVEIQEVSLYEYKALAMQHGIASLVGEMP
jgi:hypothetical protein